MTSNKKSTVRAAMAQINRDTKDNPHPKSTNTQGALSDRHVRAHTPDSLYGDDATTTE
ncbi:hypothetical protein OH768_48110 [Streptomyces sp. NBC_01622]|uniref:hypothetical protein n=1 Tax=Streptomyces sp. NBC_01622 TaxID=2975903 RepID=UPI00386AA540|nr:hypothetical protein OH768_48110 [Streptomyces sp. NBC_01622]